MLTDAEIVRRLRFIRYSSRADRYGRHIQSINAVALAAGLNRRQLYRVANGEPIGDRARVALSHALSCDVLTGEKSDVRPCDELPARAAQPGWTFSSNALISRAFASTGVPKKRRSFR
jgi:hypothetical protein